MSCKDIVVSRIFAEDIVVVISNGDVPSHQKGQRRKVVRLWGSRRPQRRYCIPNEEYQFTNDAARELQQRRCATTFWPLSEGCLSHHFGYSGDDGSCQRSSTRKDATLGSDYLRPPGFAA
jgi:hypothetical protein